MDKYKKLASKFNSKNMLMTIIIMLAVVIACAMVTLYIWSSMPM
jgi:flagellar basal body-associated protein FliL